MVTAPAGGRSLHELERLRKRTVWALVAGVALGSTGHIPGSTVATIAAEHIAGFALILARRSAVVAAR